MSNFLPIGADGSSVHFRFVRARTTMLRIVLTLTRNHNSIVTAEAWDGQRVLVAFRCVASLGTPFGRLTRTPRECPLQSGSCRSAAATQRGCSPDGRGSCGGGRLPSAFSSERWDRTLGESKSSRPAVLAAERSGMNVGTSGHEVRTHVEHTSGQKETCEAGCDWLAPATKRGGIVVDKLAARPVFAARGDKELHTGQRPT